jgi:hypothetical protein
LSGGECAGVLARALKAKNLGRYRLVVPAGCCICKSFAELR